MVKQRVTITNPTGLHLRPAGIFCNTASNFKCKVTFEYDNTIANAMQTVVGEANRTKTPIIPSVDTMVEQGGLATVGINQHALGVQAGKMAAEVLSGKSQPATTPIYTFNTGDTIINEKQAQKLGITIPAELAKKSKLIN